MPQIIVVADHEEEPAVTFRERISRVLFESEHAAAQLLERLEWAVDDAHDVERGRAHPRPLSGASRRSGFAEARGDGEAAEEDSEGLERDRAASEGYAYA